MGCMSVLCWVVLLFSIQFCWSETDDELRDKLEKSVRSLKEKNESDFRVLKQLKDEVKAQSRKLSDCKNSITKGFADYLTANREKKSLIEETAKCKQEQEEWQEKISASKQEARVRDEWKDCMVRLELAKTAPNCECEDCRENLEKAYRGIGHYTRMHNECIEMKIDHKSMKYFMQKEVSVMTEEIVNHADDLHVLNKQSQQDAEMLKHYSQTLNEFEADQKDLRESQELLEANVALVSKEYLACKKARVTAIETEIQNKNLISTLRQKIEDIQTENTLQTKKIARIVGFGELHYLIFKVLLAVFVLGMGAEIYNSTYFTAWIDEKREAYSKKQK